MPFGLVVFASANARSTPRQNVALRMPPPDNARPTAGDVLETPATSRRSWISFSSLSRSVVGYWHSKTLSIPRRLSSRLKGSVRRFSAASSTAYLSDRPRVADERRATELGRVRRDRQRIFDLQCATEGPTLSMPELRIQQIETTIHEQQQNKTGDANQHNRWIRADDVEHDAKKAGDRHRVGNKGNICLDVTAGVRA